MNRYIQRLEEFPQINKIHLLIMEPASYNVESFSKEGMTCRELENDLWSNYLGGKNNIIISVTLMIIGWLIGKYIK